LTLLLDALFLLELFATLLDLLVEFGGGGGEYVN
jgi:hypothetical protein